MRSEAEIRDRLSDLADLENFHRLRGADAPSYHEYQVYDKLIELLEWVLNEQDRKLNA